MAPPWVIFDNAASLGGQCDAGAEPLASVGIVLYFVLEGLVSTIASVLAMILEQAQRSEWRPFLDPIIIGMGDQQVLTGYALLCHGWVKVAQGSFQVDGAHFALILYIGTLSSSSQLAAMIMLRKYFDRYRLMSRIRLTSVVLYVIFLLTSIITANSMEKSDSQRLGVHLTVFLVSIFFIIIGFGTALMCILYRPQRTRSASLPSDSSGASNAHLVHKVAEDSKQTIVFPASSDVRLLNYIFLQPLTTLTLQILLATLSVVLVLSQKFAPAEDPKLWCGLSDGEISWEYSNTLCMMMVLMPAWAGLHSYLEAQRSLRE